MKLLVSTFFWPGHQQPAHSGRDQQCDGDGLQNSHAGVRGDNTGDDGKESAAELRAYEDEAESSGVYGTRKELGADGHALD